MDSLSPHAPKSKTTFIYGLIDPRTHFVRYVGKANRPKSRLHRHLRDSETLDYPVYRWIRKLKALGLTPLLVTLEEVDVENWKEAETRWIQFHRKLHGDKMLNVLHGGEGGLDIRNACRGANRPHARCNDAMVLEMRQLRHEGMTPSELAERFCVPTHIVTSVCLGNSWKHVGGPITKGKVGGNKRKPEDNKMPRKLTEDVVQELIKLLDSGISHKQVAKKLGISKSTVARFIRRKRQDEQ